MRASPALVVLAQCLALATPRRTMRIAAIFDKGSNIQHEMAFRHAVQMVNENRLDQVLRPVQSVLDWTFKTHFMAEFANIFINIMGCEDIYFPHKLSPSPYCGLFGKIIPWKETKMNDNKKVFSFVLCK